MDVVIPTYEPHFGYNIAFLDSALQFCLDRNEVTFHFIISEGDRHRTGHYHNYRGLNVRTITMKEVVMMATGSDINDAADTYCSKYTYQSIKKLFAYTITGDDYLILDSENLFVKETRMSDVFAALRNQKILYSNRVNNPLQHQVIESCNSILGYNMNSWTFLRSGWYYKKEFVQALVAQLGDNAFHKLKEHVFFEYQLYTSFLHREKLVEFQCIDDIVLERFGENLYHHLFQQMNTFEYIIAYIGDENLATYTEFIKEFNEPIIRLHWTTDNYKKAIIDNTNVGIGTFHWDVIR